MSGPVTLDTNALLMAAGAPDRLSDRARTIILDNDMVLYASTVSIFEVGTKHRIGKLRTSPEVFVQACAGFRVSFHAPNETVMLLASKLQWDHKDPWDRLIAASALHGPDGRIVTSDREFDRAHGIARMRDAE